MDLEGTGAAGILTALAYILSIPAINGSLVKYSWGLFLFIYFSSCFGKKVSNRFLLQTGIAKYHNSR